MCERDADALVLMCVGKARGRSGESGSAFLTLRQLGNGFLGVWWTSSVWAEYQHANLQGRAGGEEQKAGWDARRIS